MALSGCCWKGLSPLPKLQPMALRLVWQWMSGGRKASGGSGCLRVCAQRYSRAGKPRDPAAFTTRDGPDPWMHRSSSKAAIMGQRPRAPTHIFPHRSFSENRSVACQTRAFSNAAHAASNLAKSNPARRAGPRISCSVSCIFTIEASSVSMTSGGMTTAP